MRALLGRWSQRSLIALRARPQRRQQITFSLTEANQSIGELLHRLNHRPFRKRDGTAKLRGNACVEDIDYRAARGLDKSVIRALAQESAWVRNHEHVFILGPTGVGKSFLACALAQKACRDGYSAFYTGTAALFRDLAIARADGSLRLLLAKLCRIDVLVIDDWAMAPLTETERRDFWEICEDRYQTRSLILTSHCLWPAGTSRSATPPWLTVSSTE